MVPPKRDSAEPSLTSLGYLIKDACGNNTDNIVNFAYLKAILLIFTRHLNLLDRQVSVQHAQTHKKESQDGSNIVVGEIKVVAKGQKTDKKVAHNVSAIESHQERIFFVERRASMTSSTGYTLAQTPQSLVTKEQYKTIVNAVKKLEERFGNIDSELMESFHQKSYLSDPIAVIQLSARLEVVEKAIENIMKFLMDIKGEKETLRPQSYKSLRENTTNSTISKKNRTDVLSTSVYEFESDEPEMKLENRFSIKSNKLDNDTMQPLTSENFRRILLGFVDEMAVIVQRKCFFITLQSESASQHVTTYIGKLTADILNKIQTTTHNLENKLKEFVDGVNKLETKLRKRTAHFYETIGIMQTELDIALDRAKEVSMTPLPENKAVPDLIHNMENLLLDIQTFGEYQDDLYEKQNSLAERLKVLKKQIDYINLSKVNRVELYKALQSKNDLSVINKLMREEHTFVCLRKLHQHINDLHRYFNAHEISWQNCIDDFWRMLKEKANAVDFNAIKNDIFENLTHIDEHLDFMISSKNDINNKEDRKIILHELCISCTRPTTTVEHFKLRASKRKKPHKDNDETKICCPNHPIPHPVHPGSNCAKFCTCPHKTLTDIKTSTIPETLTTSVIVNSSSRSDCDIQKVTNNGIMRHRGPCDTSEWEKITLKHNLKFRQQPEKLIPTVIASKQSIASHGTKRSQESIASLQCKSKQRVNINYSDSLGFDIETTSEVLYVQDLDEDV